MLDQLQSKLSNGRCCETAFTLGDNSIDPAAGTLTTPSGRTQLNNKSLQVLSCLAAEAPRLVTRHDLLSKVWGDVFVGEAVLTTAIWELRSKLDSSEDVPLIETVRGKGYRLCLAPRPVPVDEDPPVESLVARSVLGVATPLLLVLTLGLGTLAMTTRPGPDSAAATASKPEAGRSPRLLIEALGRGSLEGLVAGLEQRLTEEPGALEERLRLAQIRGLQGDLAAGRAVLEETYERVPKSFTWQWRVVRTAHSLRAFERVEAMTADDAWFRDCPSRQVSDLLIYRAHALSRLGRNDEAARLVCDLHASARLQGDLGYLLAHLASESCGPQLLRRIRESVRGELDLAKIYLGLDKEELALELLEGVAEERGPELLWLALDPVFDSLANETRFQALLG